jgi:hypothetical protein
MGSEVKVLVGVGLCPRPDLDLSVDLSATLFPS